MRLTESQLRQIIRQEVRALRESNRHPKKRHTNLLEARLASKPRKMSKSRAAGQLVNLFSPDYEDKDMRDAALRTLGAMFSGNKSNEMYEIEEVVELLLKTAEDIGIYSFDEDDAQEHAYNILRNWSRAGSTQP